MRSSDDIQGMGFAGVLFDLGNLGCGDFGVIGVVDDDIPANALTLDGIILTLDTETLTLG